MLSASSLCELSNIENFIISYSRVSISIFVSVLAITYPLMKKLIPWPQVILGMAMNFGTLLGSPAVHGFSNWSVCLPLYLGGICWTVVYDTIYAFQVKIEVLHNVFFIEQ